jgi:hypothetical protein
MGWVYSSLRGSGRLCDHASLDIQLHPDISCQCTSTCLHAGASALIPVKTKKRAAFVLSAPRELLDIFGALANSVASSLGSGSGCDLTFRLVGLVMPLLHVACSSWAVRALTFHYLLMPPPPIMHIPGDAHGRGSS